MQFEWQWQNSQKSRVTEKRKSLEIGKNRNQGYKLSLKVLHSLLESKLWNKLNLTVHFLDNDKMTIFRNFFISGNTIKLPKTVLNSHEEFEKIQENENKDPIDRSVKNFPCIICRRVFFPVPSLESGSRVCIDICTDGTYGSRGDKEKEKEKEKGGHHPSMISEGFMHGDGGVDEENEGGISDTRNRMWFCPTNKCGGACHIYCLATAGERIIINDERDHVVVGGQGRDREGHRAFSISEEGNEEEQIWGGILHDLAGKETRNIDTRKNRMGMDEIQDHGRIVESTKRSEGHSVVRRESMIPSWGVCRKCGEKFEWVKIISDVCITHEEDKQRLKKKQGKRSNKDRNNKSAAVQPPCDKAGSYNDSDKDVDVDRENDDDNGRNNSNNDDDSNDDDDFRFDSTGRLHGKRNRECDDSGNEHFSNARRGEEGLNSFNCRIKSGTGKEGKARSKGDEDKDVGIGRIVINLDSDSDDDMDADEGEILFIGDASDEEDEGNYEDEKEESGNKKAPKPYKDYYDDDYLDTDDDDDDDDIFLVKPRAPFRSKR